jgi:hypothetical protein
MCTIFPVATKIPSFFAADKKRKETREKKEKEKEKENKPEIEGFSVVNNWLIQVARKR